MRQIRTDLAIEMHEMLTEAAEELSGVSVNREEKRGTQISRVKIEDLEAQAKMGRPIGNYITVEFPELNLADGEDYENLCHVLAEELSALLTLGKNSKVLVVGLGNESITPDALGPKVVARLMVTRHLFTYMPDELSEGIRSVCAIAPGVLGTTGMETGEIIQSLVDKIRPDALVAIDALAARSIDRISTTVQLCDTGIAPGSGVGNKRKALDRSTLGVPVIAIGVPTVIDAATITADVLELAASSLAEGAEEIKTALSAMDRDEQYALFRGAVPEQMGGFIVTPKDVDLTIDRVSRAVAGGINFALHEGITLADMEAFIS